MAWIPREAACCCACIACYWNLHIQTLRQQHPGSQCSGCGAIPIVGPRTTLSGVRWKDFTEEKTSHESHHNMQALSAQCVLHMTFVPLSEQTWCSCLQAAALFLKSMCEPMICHLWSRWQLLSTEESASWKLFWLQERLSVHHFSRHIGCGFLDSPTTLINFVHNVFSCSWFFWTGKDAKGKGKGCEKTECWAWMAWRFVTRWNAFERSTMSIWLESRKELPWLRANADSFVLRKSDCHDWQARTGLWQRIPCGCSSFWWMSFFHCQAWAGKGAGGTNSDVWGPESWRPMWLYLAGWMDPAAIAQHFGFALGAKVCDFAMGFRGFRNRNKLLTKVLDSQGVYLSVSKIWMTSYFFVQDLQ